MWESSQPLGVTGDGPGDPIFIGDELDTELPVPASFGTSNDDDDPPTNGSSTSDAVAVERIEDPDQSIAALRALASSARRQLLIALPHGEYSVDVVRDSWDVDIAMLARGVDIRVVYPA
jgi:hypothetical protein